VAATLQKNGFRVTQAYDNNTVVDAVGTVGAADKLFATDIHLVSQPGQGLRYANATPAHEPAALRGLLTSVSGLQTITVIKTAVATVPPRLGLIAPDLAGPPLKGPVSTATGLAGFGPLAFSQGYLFPEQFKNSASKYYDGTGRKSGIVIDADFLDSDLSAYLKYFRAPR
jgi:hypothetical protein